jgi:hypothetical protein
VPNTDDHNLLAARASRLGDAALDVATLRSLLEPHEPLLAEPGGLDRSALTRRLVATSFVERANALAFAESGAEEEAALGWVELGRARIGRAARHFTRALELAPGTPDALAGLLASRRFEVTERRAIPGFSEAALDERLAAVVAGWRHVAAADWEAVAALDAELARSEPGQALFEEAARLRARWRLETADAEEAAEAQELLETLLLRNWTPLDGLLRARAAIAAGRPAAAWGALIRISEMRTQELPEGLALRALEIAEALPEEMARDLRGRLQARRRRAGGR